MTAPNFDDYKDSFEHVRMRREDGILELTLHTEGDEIVWGGGPHGEMGYVFETVGTDPENKVVILTGTGNSFIAKETLAANVGALPAERWTYSSFFNARRIHNRLLDIEVPMIAAINGPATIHAEIGLLCDVVLCSDDTYFQDFPHYINGVVPGDGVQIMWPLLLGINRARYFLVTGQKLPANEALALGVVNEVLPRAELLDRAWAIALKIVGRPGVLNRLTRAAITAQLKRRFQDELPYGLVLEGLSAADSWPSEFTGEF